MNVNGVFWPFLSFEPLFGLLTVTLLLGSRLDLSPRNKPLAL